MVHHIFRGVVTYACLWPTSELTRQVGQQILEGKKINEVRYKELNVSRAVNFALYGGLYSAPVAYLWMSFLVKKIPGKKLQNVLLKTLCDQVLYAPFSICCFYTGINLLEKKSFSDIITEIKAKFALTYTSGLSFWPFVQLTNFFIVPDKNRVVFTGVASFIWTVYLSFVKDKKNEEI
ncbi:mpv17-like protein isoform X1 [Artemia franciscana]|uniref:mpv17-like protein isoform X1 n=1 Tax=Artemia franciscana TaxID=6661 RepID=UPI0032DA2431